MVHTLHLEEEFNKQVSDRMVMMIQDLVAQGKSRAEILEFLTKNLGINPQDAGRILNEIISQGDIKGSESMYG
jgi:hypoxanthine-guanine phosphoribosyltransferase